MSDNSIRIGNVEIMAVADASGLSGADARCCSRRCEAAAWAPFTAISDRRRQDA